MPPSILPRRFLLLWDPPAGIVCCALPKPKIQNNINALVLASRGTFAYVGLTSTPHQCLAIPLTIATGFNPKPLASASAQRQDGLRARLAYEPNAACKGKHRRA
jgi:hypothetical protein